LSFVMAIRINKFSPKVHRDSATRLSREARTRFTAVA
jgi:hypothetical protein